MIAVIRVRSKRTEYHCKTEAELNELVSNLLSNGDSISDINIYDDSYTEDITESMDVAKKLFPPLTE